MKTKYVIRIYFVVSAVSLNKKNVHTGGVNRGSERGAHELNPGGLRSPVCVGRGMTPCTSFRQKSESAYDELHFKKSGDELHSELGACCLIWKIFPSFYKYTWYPIWKKTTSSSRKTDIRIQPGENKRPNKRTIRAPSTQFPQPQCFLGRGQCHIQPSDKGGAGLSPWTKGQSGTWVVGIYRAQGKPYDSF